MELATLGIAVDSRQVRAADSDLKKLSDTGARTERSLEGVGAAGRDAARGSDATARSSRDAAMAMDRQDSAAKRLTMSVRYFAAAALAAGAASVAWAASMTRHLDQTSKMAQQIGVTTEALTGMRFAAQQFANISGQQFDMSMRRMTRRIEEAAAGGGAAKGALDALGLSARELSRMSPDQQMLALADAMAKTESQAQRLQYTMALFDTEGMALVPALQQGSAALRDAAEMAQRFGVILSTDLAQAAEQFTTNMSLLNSVQQGYRQEIAERILPTIVSLTDRIIEFATQAGPASERVEKAFTAIGVAATATAAIIAGRLVGSITASAASWVAATAAAARHQMQLVQLSASIGAASAAMTGLSAAASGAMTVIARAAGGLSAVMGGPLGVITATGLAAAAFLTMGRDARSAATDIDELAASIGTLSQRQLGLKQFELEEGIEQLEKRAVDSHAILTGLQNDVKELSRLQAEGYNITAREMDNAQRALLEEQEAYDKINAELDRKRDLYDQIVGRLREMTSALHGTTAGVNALNQAMGFSEAGEKYLAQLQGQIKALQDGGDPIKIATRWVEEHADATDADKTAIMSAAQALKTLQDAQTKAAQTTRGAAKALTEAQRAAQAFRREQDQSLRAQLQSVSAIHAQAQALEDQVALFGQSATAIEDLTIARLEEQVAMLRGFEGSQEQVEAIEREIEARKRLRTAIGSMEQKEAERDAWEDWSRDVEQIFDRVGQSLTDAIFDGGKSAKDLLRDLFKGLTFNVLINPVMKQMQGWVTQQLGGMFGYQNPQQQQSGGGGFGFSGGGTFGAGGVQMAGDWLLRSGLAPETGAKMLMNADAIAKVGGNILGYGKAIYDLSQGNYGAAAGTAIGTYFGGPVGAVAGNFLGGIVDSIFDRTPTTRRMQRVTSEYGDGEYQITSRDGRQAAGTEDLVRQLAESAVQSTNDLFERVGVAASVNSLFAITESSYKGDRQGVASGGTLQLGDTLVNFGLQDLYDRTDMTKSGFGGWSEAEMLPRLQTDLQLSILSAFQAAGDQLPSVLSGMLEGVDIRSLGAEQAEALAQSFQLVIDQVSAFQVAVESLPFANLRDLSFDAAANLISFAGGLENLSAGTTSYFQAFFSESEQIEWMTQQLTSSLSDLGFEMPDLAIGADAAKASLRQFVEGLDVTDEAGARAFAGVMNLAGSYAELANRSEELANKAIEDAQRIDDRIASERYSLETQLLQLQGDTITLRMRELETIDVANRGLQKQIWTLQDAAQAAEQAAISQQAYQNSIQSITGSLSGLRETITLDQLGTDEARYGYFKSQSDALAAMIPDLEDADAITRAINQIQSYTSRAYGTLDSEQKLEMGDEFLSYLNRTEDLALKQIEIANQQQADRTGEAVAKAVGEHMGRFVDAIVRVASDSGEVSRETLQALKKLAGQTGHQVSGRYPEVNNRSEVNA